MTPLVHRCPLTSSLALWLETMCRVPRDLTWAVHGFHISPRLLSLVVASPPKQVFPNLFYPMAHRPNVEWGEGMVAESSWTCSWGGYRHGASQDVVVAWDGNGSTVCSHTPLEATPPQIPWHIRTCLMAHPCAAAHRLGNADVS